MAFGSKNARGIYLYGEDDNEANHSTLLNKGQQSVSDATKYFSGTPAQRALLTPAPAGATWMDTDAAGRIWYGKGGVWVSATGHAVAAYAATPGATQDPSRMQIRTGLASGNTDNTGVLDHTFTYPFPTACIGVMFMPNQNKGAPVLVENSPTKTGFQAFFAGSGNASRAIQFIAFGY